MRENVKRDKNRLHFHMMPPTGWMNDPNGLCQFHGINHIYFQYTPFLAGWGRSFGDIIRPKTGFITRRRNHSSFQILNGTEMAYTVVLPLVKEDGIHFFYTEM